MVTEGQRKCAKHSRLFRWNHRSRKTFENLIRDVIDSYRKKYITSSQDCWKNSNSEMYLSQCFISVNVFLGCAKLHPDLLENFALYNAKWTTANQECLIMQILTCEVRFSRTLLVYTHVPRNGSIMRKLKSTWKRLKDSRFRPLTEYRWTFWKKSQIQVWNGIKKGALVELEHRRELIERSSYFQFSIVCGKVFLNYINSTKNKCWEIAIIIKRSRSNLLRGIEA